MNGFYNHFKGALLNSSTLLDSAESVAFYKQVMRPCWHSRGLRFREWLRGHEHAAEHLVNEPYIRMALVDVNPVERDSMTMTVKPDGTFTVS